MSDRLGLTALDGADDFDPESVPVYPLVRAELRHSDDGGFAGVVDDQTVAVERELEPARQAVIDAAAAVAGRRIGPVKATRVRGTSPDGSVFWLVVTAAGEVHEVTEVGGAQTGKSGTRSGRSDVQKGQAGRKGAVGKSARGRSRVSPLFVAVIMLPLLLVGVPLTVQLVRHFSVSDVEYVPPPPKPVQLPVVPPRPYDDVAAWSQGLGEAFSSAGAQVAADEQLVFAVGDSGMKVSAFAVSSGVEQWQFSELRDAISVGPAVATVDGRRMLVVATASQLVLLDPSTGSQVSQWEIPDGSTVRLTATGPVVMVDSVRARVVSQGRLVERVIPATGTPVAPLGSGALLVAGPEGQVWTVTDSRVAGDPEELDIPDGLTFGDVVGWAGNRLVLGLYGAEDVAGTSSTVLAAFAAPTAESDPQGWERAWVSKSVPNAYGVDGQDLPLAAAPSAAWGVYGTTAVDLTTGETVALVSDWHTAATTAVGDQLAFGTGAGRPLVASPDGVLSAASEAPQPPAGSTLVPPQAVSGTTGFVVATSDGRSASLYAIRLPDGAVATRTSSETPKDEQR